MTKFLVTLLAVISLLSTVHLDAEARRMGGSKSFGRQSSNVQRQQAPAQPAGINQAKPGSTPAGAATATKPASPWKGMLGGALLGLGLGALLSNLGLGAGMASIINMVLMAGIGIALVIFFTRLGKQKTGPVSTVKNGYVGPKEFTSSAEIGSRITDVGLNAPTLNSTLNPTLNPTINPTTKPTDSLDATWEIPPDFDVAQFERTAQMCFIRLQAAWDKADSNDIREFTTPEMYAEVKLQLQERGATPSVTDVMTVHAKLLGIETQESIYLASVRFAGTIKEDINAPTISFEEVWNLSKPLNGQGGWLLAGIQQVEK